VSLLIIIENAFIAVLPAELYGAWPFCFIYFLLRLVQVWASGQKDCMDSHSEWNSV